MHFPLKWDPQASVPAMVKVNFDLIPESAREQAILFFAIKSEDRTAEWIAGPLAHAANHVRPFDPAQFSELADRPIDGPPNFNRHGWLTALSVLSRNYPEIPTILWDTIAIMGLRPSPHVEEEIPNLGRLLPHDWGISDAALHAAAKATSFWSDINYNLVLHSGCYAEHGCACNHIVRGLLFNGNFPAMPEDRKPQITYEWWTHFMSELSLIYIDGLPFRLNVGTNVYRRTLLVAEA